MIYNIAYKDRDGKDFNGLPWLDGYHYSLDEVKDGIKRLEDLGCIEITPFIVNTTVSEDTTWEYVNQNKIKEIKR